VLSGTARVGHVLSVSTGSWSGTPPLVYTYQWQRCTPSCADIAGATSRIRSLTAVDTNVGIRVIVTARNEVGATRAPSNQLGPVVAAPPSAAAIRALLLRELIPHGKHASIRALREHGYRVSFTPPSGGTLTIVWYLARPRRVRVALLRRTFTEMPTGSVTIRLNARGRLLLAHAARARLMASVTLRLTGRTAITVRRTVVLHR
jgi:hypothetical protein